MQGIVSWRRSASVMCYCLLLYLIERVSVVTEVSVYLEKLDTVAFLAAGVSKGGCAVASASGIYVTINSSSSPSVSIFEDLGMYIAIYSMQHTELSLHYTNPGRGWKGKTHTADEDLHLVNTMIKKMF